MRRSKTHDWRLEAAKLMPRLKKRPNPDAAYNPATDQVVLWISQNQQLQSYLFDLINRLGYIKYDEKTGTWSGTDHED